LPSKIENGDSPELLLDFEIFSDSEFIIDELMVDTTIRQGPFTNQNGSENVAKQTAGIFAGHIPQVTTTGHSIFAPKQHKKSLNSALLMDRTRQALMYIFSKNMFRLGAQLL